MLNKVKGYEAKFIKKNGEERNMTFVKVSDLPDDFVKAKIRGTGKERKFGEEMELVWEISENKSGFRVFNWATIIGDAKEVFLNNEHFTLDKS